VLTVASQIHGDVTPYQIVQMVWMNKIAKLINAIRCPTREFPFSPKFAKLIRMDIRQSMK
jgi:hypothetical protein